MARRKTMRAFDYNNLDEQLYEREIVRFLSAIHDIYILNPDISPKKIEKTLKELVNEGYIKKIGQGRNTVYAKVID